jgi:hypothetical protein
LLRSANVSHVNNVTGRDTRQNQHDCHRTRSAVKFAGSSLLVVRQCRPGALPSGHASPGTSARVRLSPHFRAGQGRGEAWRADDRLAKLRARSIAWPSLRAPKIGALTATLRSFGREAAARKSSRWVRSAREAFRLKRCAHSLSAHEGLASACFAHNGTVRHADRVAEHDRPANNPGIRKVTTVRQEHNRRRRYVPAWELPDRPLPGPLVPRGSAHSGFVPFVSFVVDSLSPSPPPAPPRISAARRSRGSTRRT